jgi:YfiH family protein
LKSSFPSEDPAVLNIVPKIFAEKTNILAGMSTRRGCDPSERFGMNLGSPIGDEPKNVAANKKIFFAHFGLSEKNLALPLQCHSTTVCAIIAPGQYEACDALITLQQHIILAVTIADCVPIMLLDPIIPAVGIVHAGWRGTSGGIVQKTVVKMIQEYKTDPAQVLAFIGPSAGKCCYEVGNEVAVMFGKKSVPFNKTFLDLKNENMLQLLQVGVKAEHIEVSAFCTICEKELFHSFRRDGRNAGRMMAFICITN